jgi:hypothetical protein
MSVLLTIQQGFPISLLWTHANCTVPACRESEPQNRVVLARNGSTDLVTSYELESGNPSRSVLLSILQCYPASFIRTQATGTVPACRESEPQNRSVLARNGGTYPVTSYELETRNPSRSVLRSILHGHLTSFLPTQATGTAPACKESEPQNCAILA